VISRRIAAGINRDQAGRFVTFIFGIRSDSELLLLRAAQIPGQGHGD
jgi:hypothetical protein